jgi:tyrosyl-tRNA synthetase
VEERTVESGLWRLPRLLIETGLTPSTNEARRLIEQGGVYVDGERRARTDNDVSIGVGHTVLIQVGKRRFLRVRGI